MGSKICQNLVTDGFSVHAFNRTADKATLKGAVTIVQSPQDTCVHAAGLRNVVITMVKSLVSLFHAS